MRYIVLHLAVLIVGVIGGAFAQNLSIGAVAGTNVTPNFQSYSTANGIYYTNTRTAFGGVIVEWSLPGPVSIEADGLYRRLHALLPPASSFSVVTWEFPILANYRLSVAGVKVLVEGGPSFRSTGNLNDIHPSHYGVTAGLGVETQVGQFRIAPLARYTHWGPDAHPGPSSIQTRADQLDLLVTVRARSPSNAHPISSRLSFGAVLGTSLSHDFGSVTISESAAVRGPLANIGYSVQPLNASFRLSPGPLSFQGGPVVSLQVVRHFAIQGQAVYRPLRSSVQVVSGDSRTRLNLNDHRTSWEFPILTQYQLRAGGGGPFVELGPAFRLLQDVYGSSPYGVAAGAGVRARIWRLRIAPGVRFTRWAEHNPPAPTDPRRNELAILTGFLF